MVDQPAAPLSDVSTIRRHARQHLKDGAVTQGYDADRHGVLRLLNEALATEIVCTLRYRRHYYMANGILAESVKAEFLKHAIEEQAHADRLAERIVQLGGEPDFDPATLSARSHAEYVEGANLEEMIKEDLIAERIAIESYREMIGFVSTRDSTTRRVLETILAAEEEHAEELASMLIDVRQLLGGARAEADSGESPVVDIPSAIKDPAAVFSAPHDVVEDASLSADDKRLILSSWVKDSELLATATDENMGGGEQPRLRESKLALAELENAEGRSDAKS